MKTRTYYINDDRYDIPESDVVKFLSDAAANRLSPREGIKYNRGSETWIVPADETKDFQTAVPGATRALDKDEAKHAPYSPLAIIREAPVNPVDRFMKQSTNQGFANYAADEKKLTSGIASNLQTSARTKSNEELRASGEYDAILNWNKEHPGSQIEYTKPDPMKEIRRKGEAALGDTPSAGNASAARDTEMASYEPKQPRNTEPPYMVQALMRQQEEIDRQLLISSARRGAWTADESTAYAKLLRKSGEIDSQMNAAWAGLTVDQYLIGEAIADYRDDHPIVGHSLLPLFVGAYNIATGPARMFTPGEVLAEISKGIQYGASKDANLLETLAWTTFQSLPQTITAMMSTAQGHPEIGFGLMAADIAASNIKDIYDDRQIGLLSAAEAEGMYVSAVFNGLVQSAIEMATTGKQMSLWENAWREGGKDVLDRVVRGEIKKLFSTSAKQFAQTQLLGGLTEAGEELAQNITDRVIRSATGQQVSSAEEWGKELVMDAIGGFVGGVIFGSVQTGYNMRLQSKTAQAIEYNATRYPESVAHLKQAIIEIQNGNTDAAEGELRQALIGEEYDKVAKSSPEIQRGYNLAMDAIRMNKIASAFTTAQRAQDLKSSIRSIEQELQNLKQKEADNAGLNDEDTDTRYLLEDRLKVNEAELREHERTINADKIESEIFARLMEISKIEQQIKQIANDYPNNPEAQYKAGIQALRDVRVSKIDANKRASRALGELASGEQHGIGMESMAQTETKYPMTTEMGRLNDTQNENGIPGSRPGNATDQEQPKFEFDESEIPGETPQEKRTNAIKVQRALDLAREYEFKPDDSWSRANRRRDIKKWLDNYDKYPDTMTEYAEQAERYRAEMKAIDRFNRIMREVYGATPKLPTIKTQATGEQTRPKKKRIITWKELDNLPHLRAMYGRTFAKGEGEYFADIWVEGAGWLVNLDDEHDDSDTIHEKHVETPIGERGMANADSSEIIEAAKQEWLTRKPVTDIYDEAKLNEQEAARDAAMNELRDRYENTTDPDERAQILDDWNRLTDISIEGLMSELGETEYPEGYDETAEMDEEDGDASFDFGEDEDAPRYKKTEAQGKPSREEAVDALKAAVGFNSKTDKITEGKNGSVTIDLADGRRIVLNQVNEISVYDPATGEYQGQAAGRTRRRLLASGKVEIIIDLVDAWNGGNRAGYHENFHMAWYLFTTPEQRQFLTDYYTRKILAGEAYDENGEIIKMTSEQWNKLSSGARSLHIEEQAAQGSEAWNGRRRDKVPSMVNRIWQRIMDKWRAFLVKIGRASDDQKLEDIFRRAATGKLGGEGTPAGSAHNMKRVPSIAGLEPVTRHKVIPTQAEIAEAERQYAEVEAKYRGTDAWLKAPNGKKSNLNERQWVQVRTPAFKAWFGDWENDPANASKVVDENGEPMVVYHGTGTEISQFKYEFLNNGNDQYNSGFYFTTDLDQAKGYMSATLGGKDKLGGTDSPNIVSVFLNIRNPIKVDSDTPNLYDTKFTKQQIKELLKNAPNIRNAHDSDNPQSVLGDWYSEYWDIAGNEKGEIPESALIGFVNKIIRDIGEESLNMLTIERDFYDDDVTAFHNQVRRLTNWDGVEIEIGNGSRHYVAWLNTQIKSATGNIGTFDAENADIRYKLAPTEITEAERQYAEVEAKYRGTDKWLKAPNGKPTKLNERQWVQVRTENFKAWFGDWENDPKNASKVVDENGEPMVVWHTTNDDPFYEFNTFSTSKLGKFFGNGSYFSQRANAYYGKNTIGVFLNIRNPVYFTDFMKEDASRYPWLKRLHMNDWMEWNDRRLYAMLRQQPFNEKEPPKTIVQYNKTVGGYPGWQGMGHVFDPRSLRTAISKEHGYDGIVVDSVMGEILTDVDQGKEFVVYKSTQIKSATENVGTFDAENPDIRYKTLPAQSEIAEAERQYAEVEAKYRGTDAWLKAPNGKPTNLNERQWVQVRTPAFKAWFGDWENDPANASKVVDENGEPMVVYHGTVRQFSEFSKKATSRHIEMPGFYFTPDAEIAEQFAQDAYTEIRDNDGWVVGAEGGVIYPVFLSVRNPVIINVNDTRATMTNFHSILEKINDGISSGLDGAIINGWADGSGDTQIASFSPTQIKSATANVGTFDSENPDIRYKVGPAYHGSGAAFDKFDMKFVGTGEGVQAFGFGIYISQREGVAKSYAEKLGMPSQHNLVPAMDIYRNLDLPDVALARKMRKIFTNELGLGGNPEKAIKSVLEFLDNIKYHGANSATEPNFYYADNNALINDVDRLKSLTTVNTFLLNYQPGQRNLYTVDVWADRTEDVLDWYGKPTQEQANKIKAEAAKEGINIGFTKVPVDFQYVGDAFGLITDQLGGTDEFRDGDFIYSFDFPYGGTRINVNTGKQINITEEAFAKAFNRLVDKQKLDIANGTGESIYHKLSRHFGSDKAASEFLLRAGIDGIKYPVNALSGGKGEKGYNYVVFDANEIVIEEHIQYKRISEEMVQRMDRVRAMMENQHNAAQQQTQKMVAELKEKGFDPKQVEEKLGRQMRAAFREAASEVNTLLAASKITGFEQWIVDNKPINQGDLTFHNDEAIEYAKQMGMDGMEAADLLGGDGYTWYLHGLQVFMTGNQHLREYTDVVEQIRQQAEKGLVDPALQEKKLILAGLIGQYSKAWDLMKTNAGRLLQAAKARKIEQIRNFSLISESITEDVQRLKREVETLEAELQEALTIQDEIDAMIAELQNAYDALIVQLDAMGMHMPAPGSDINRDAASNLRTQADAIKEKLDAMRARQAENLHRIQQMRDGIARRTEMIKVGAQTIIDQIDPLIEPKKPGRKPRAPKIHDIKPTAPTWYDISKSNYYQNILSSPMTHYRNITGNISNLMAELMVNWLTTGKDGGVSLQGMLKHALEAAQVSKETFANASEYLKKYDLQDSKNLTKAMKFFTGITRLLAAEDAFFFHLAFNMQLQNLAAVQAKTRGEKRSFEQILQDALGIYEQSKTEAQKTNHTLEDVIYRSLSTPDIIKQAYYEAKRMTYNQNPEGLMGIANAAIEKFIHGLEHDGYQAAALAFKFTVMPFTRIVANVTNFGIDWSPLGFVRAYEYAKHGKSISAQQGIWTDENGKPALSPYQKRDLSRQLARAILGTLAMIMAMTLLRGRISGGGPRDKDERQRLMAAGWRPYSIKIGERWIPYNDLWFSTVLAVAGNLNDYSEYNKGYVPKSGWDQATYAMMGVSRTFLDKSFLGGMSDTFAAVSRQDSKFITRSVANVPGNIIPYANGLRWLNDLFYHQQHAPETIAQYLAMNARPLTTPWLKQAVPISVDEFGQPIKKASSLAPVIGTPVRDGQPFYVYDAQNMPRNIRDIINAVNRQQLEFPSMRMELKLGDEYITLRGFDKQRMLQLRGRELSLGAIDHHDEILRLSEANDRDALDKLLRKIGDKASDRAREYYRDILLDEDKINLKARDPGGKPLLVHKYEIYAKEKDQ